MCCQLRKPDQRGRLTLSEPLIFSGLDQFQFAVFDRENIEKMRVASGEFSDRKPVDLGTLLQFQNMRIVVRRDFPEDLVATVTHNLIKCRNEFSIPLNLNPKILDDPNLHQGAKEAIKIFFSWLTQHDEAQLVHTFCIRNCMGIGGKRWAVFSKCYHFILDYP